MRARVPLRLSSFAPSDSVCICMTFFAMNDLMQMLFSGEASVSNVEKTHNQNPSTRVTFFFKAILETTITLKVVHSARSARARRNGRCTRSQFRGS